jgi:type I restriction enzyme S subunit
VKLLKLVEVCNLVGGGTPSKANSDFYLGEIPWATVRDLRSRWLEETEYKINEVAVRKSSTNVIPAGNVVLASRVGLGKVVQLKSDTAINQDLRALVPRENSNIDSSYLYYWTLSISPQIISAGKGATVQGVTLPFLENLEIPVPSIDKQKEIVELLDSAFAQIDLLEENLAGQISGLAEITAEKLDQVFSGKTKSLTDFRALTLGEIARVINGRAYSQPELLKEGPYPVLRVGNFFSNRSWYYSDLELDKDKYCVDGDLLYAWSASFGPRIWDGGKVIYHYHIWKIEEKKDLVLRDWLYWWLLWDVNQIKKAHGTGSTMMHVTKGAMENRPIQLPSLTIQSQQLREITELQLATQKLDTNYKSLTENWSNLRNAILTSAFMEGVA